MQNLIGVAAAANCHLLFDALSDMVEISQLVARDCDDVFQAGYLSTLVRLPSNPAGKQPADIANRPHLLLSEGSTCWQPTTARRNYACIWMSLLARERVLETLIPLLLLSFTWYPRQSLPAPSPRSFVPARATP